MNSKTAILSYNDYEFKLLVYGSVDDKPFLLYEKKIDKVNVNLIKSDLERDKLASKIKEAISACESELAFQILKLNICFEPEKYFYSTKVFSFDFETPHLVGKNDLKKVHVHAKNSEKGKEGFVVADFTVSKYTIDDIHDVIDPLDKEVKKLQVTGDVIFADSTTYYNVVSIVSIYKIEIGKVSVGNYMLKKDTALENQEAIVDIVNDRINFIVNQNGNVKQFSVKAGVKRFYEDLFKKLSLEYSAEESESAIRFLMRYFTLISLPENVNVTKNIKINDLINEFDTIIVDYFSYLLEELKRQNIIISDMQLLLNDYEDKEFIFLLDKALDINVRKFTFNNKYNDVKENAKAHLAMKQIMLHEQVFS